MTPVSTAYDFTRSGAGSYSIAAAANRFYYVDGTGTPAELFATLSDAHVTDVSGKLAVARPTKAKRVTYNGTSEPSNEGLRHALNLFLQVALPPNRLRFLLPHLLLSPTPLVHTRTPTPIMPPQPASRRGSART